MSIFKQICSLPEFDKDLKKLSKKFRTLEEDLRNFINAQLNLYHKIGQDNGGIVQIPGLQIETPKIYKAKKFTCRSLPGKGVQSGIRVIYAYFEDKDKIEFIEIYYKEKNSTMEDRSRIIRNYAENQ